MFSKFTYGVVTPDKYPASIQNLPDVPKQLYVLGNADLLNSTKTASVVGTRKISRQGAEFGRTVVGRMCQDGFTVVSGLALGSDRVAHNTAIKHGCSQIAVLPCGFKRFTPKTNLQVAIQILEQDGCLVSEYEPTTPANRETYLARNRLIASLGNSLTVLECEAQSGTMSTVRHASKLNKPILAYLPKNPSSKFKTSGAKVILDKYNGLRMTQ